MALAALSWIYAAFGDVGPVKALFFGLKAAVLAVVLEAILRIGRRALKTTAHLATAALAFVALFFFALPFPLVIAGAAVLGFIGSRIDPAWFAQTGGHGAAAHDAGPPAAIDAAFARGIPSHVRPSLAHFLAIAVIGGVLWLGPVVVLQITLGSHNVFAAIAAFNAKMAAVTFGGAYAVLAYMAQQAVEHYHWLKPDEMLVGLGFAETTPGPLICVVEFVGFMAAWRAPGALSPALAGLAGGGLAMWTTFVPSFLWIFLGGPYVEALIGIRPLNAALSAITAAVVGVILNLAVWLFLHTIFGSVAVRHISALVLNVPDFATLHWPALILSAAAVVAMLRFKVGMLPTLAACSIAGVVYYAIAAAP